jgi:hypothetical protein
MSTTKNTPKTETTYNNKMEGSSNGPNEINMSDLASLASYFSGSIEKMDNEKFEREVEAFIQDPTPIRSMIDEMPLVKRPRKGVEKNVTYRKRKGTAPPWKRSERQKKKDAIRESAREQFTEYLSLPDDGTPSGFSIFDEPSPERMEVKPKAKKGKKPKTKKEVRPKRETVADRFRKAMKTRKEREANMKYISGNISGASHKLSPTIKTKGKPTRPTRKAPDIPKGARPWIPADSVVTKVGPGKFNIEVNLNRPLPKSRTVLPRERPVPKPRTVLSRERPVPKPRTKKPTEKPISPPRIRKPVKQLREVKLQPPVITPEEYEIDPFGTDLQKPTYRKVETAVDGAAVTSMISPTYLDPQNQLTASRQVVRIILEKELSRMGGVKYTETLKVRMMRGSEGLSALQVEKWNGNKP